MPRCASISAVVFTLVAAGCGAATGLGYGGSPSTRSTTTTSAGSSGSGAAPTTTTTATTSAPGFPVGTFTACASGLVAPDGGPFLSTNGAYYGEQAFTVAQQGAALAVTYANGGGADDAFTFQPASDTYAVLAPVGVTAGGYYEHCGSGQPLAATLTTTAGALTYDEGTVFLSLAGAAAGGEGTSCAASAPARAWVICGGAEGPSGTAPAGPAPAFPVGTYACASEIATYDDVDGTKTYASGLVTGGTLTVTQSGATVTASYTGDPSTSATLDFTVTTPASASAVPGQTLLAECATDPNHPGAPEALSITAGSLVMVDETTLFLLVNG